MNNKTARKYFSQNNLNIIKNKLSGHKKIIELSKFST